MRTELHGFEFISMELECLIPPWVVSLEASVRTGLYIQEVVLNLALSRIDDVLNLG
jgi:hypothetical protein